jgi:plasmid maintenance system antidote protein VapI
LKRKGLLFDLRCAYNWAMRLNKKKILFELKRLGWKQKELARAMRVKRQWVNYLLNTDNGLTFKTVERIATALQLDPKDLIQ